MTQSGFCIFLTVPEGEERSTGIGQKQKKGGAKSDPAEYEQRRQMDADRRAAEKEEE